MKGYKGFKKDLTCMGFKFEEGKTYIIDGAIKLCKKGFHFCENPFDVADYYDITDSDFAEVESGENTLAEGDKTVTSEIKIGVRLGLKGWINACVDFAMKNSKPGDKVQSASGDSSQLAASGYSSKLAASGDFSQLAASGYSSQLAASGYSSQLAASGDFSQLAASGDSSKLAASGDFSQLAASGDSSKLAASGYSSQLAASGYSSQLAASGDSSQLAASGDSSKLAASGYSSVVAGIGVDNMAKAVKGCWIVLAEWVIVDTKRIPKYVKSVKVDGKKIKANTWYKLKNGKFVVAQ